jgi:hypothetical protein
VSHFVAFPHDGGAPHGRSGNIQARRLPGTCCCSPALEWPSRVTCVQEAGHQHIGCMQGDACTPDAIALHSVAKPAPRASLPSTPWQDSAAFSFGTPRCGCSARRDSSKSRNCHGNENGSWQTAAKHLIGRVKGHAVQDAAAQFAGLKFHTGGRLGARWDAQPTNLCVVTLLTLPPRLVACASRTKEFSRKRWGAVANAGERVPALCPGGRCRVKRGCSSELLSREGWRVPVLPGLLVALRVALRVAKGPLGRDRRSLSPHSAFRAPRCCGSGAIRYRVHHRRQVQRRRTRSRILQSHKDQHYVWRWLWRRCNWVGRGRLV